jgi:hypothetical protein
VDVLAVCDQGVARERLVVLPAGELPDAPHSAATGMLFIRAPKMPSSLRLPDLPPELDTSPPLGMLPGNPCLRLSAGQCGLAPAPQGLFPE